MLAGRGFGWRTYRAILTTSATITVGGTVNDELESAGDQDWYRLELTAGQEVVITLTGLTLGRPVLQIRDFAGNIVFARTTTSGPG